MKLVLPDVSEIVLTIGARFATVYIKQGDLPNATVTFESAREARQYIRRLKSSSRGTMLVSPPVHFLEINLAQQTDRKVRL